ncbi:MAG: hypothetical protein LCH36_00350 [Actinobacteria bacterium]|nr:hypothetical protein [Actinomycetota bacterium]
MTTLRNLVNTVRESAQDAQTAATTARQSVQTALAPVRADLAETQHELAKQGTALDETHASAESALSKVAELENAVDTLILDALMDGI